MSNPPENPSALACAIILAAGSGSRARLPSGGEDRPKQFLELGGKPLLAWSLGTLSAHPRIGMVILVLPLTDMTDADRWAAHAAHGTRLRVVAGGRNRRESTLAALEALAREPGHALQAPVLVHDGARPFASAALVDRLLAALENGFGAIPCLPITDTLKSVDGALLSRGPDRNGLVSVQTPQAFRGDVLLEAHRKVAAIASNEDFTDDASIVEWAGHPCRAVPGERDNIKITTADDWARARAIAQQGDAAMMEPHTGLGYDVHRLVPANAARPGVWLCGHFIAHSHTLDGHSDADVGLHALTDALLGAIGEGDIGTHFPPSDPQWKGAASHIFLSHAADLVRARGGRIVHVDVALVAENPKIGPHRPAMIAAMAKALAISPGRVSVKATTNEKLGFAGREEGIAALATATVLVPGDD